MQMLISSGLGQRIGSEVEHAVPVPPVPPVVLPPDPPVPEEPALPPEPRIGLGTQRLLSQMRPSAQSVSLVQPLSSSGVVEKHPCTSANDTVRGMNDHRLSNPSAMRPRFARAACPKSQLFYHDRSHDVRRRGYSAAVHGKIR